jgi:hypothetical protein
MQIKVWNRFHPVKFRLIFEEIQRCLTFTNLPPNLRFERGHDAHQTIVKFR